MNYYITFIYFLVILKFTFFVFFLLEKIFQHKKNKDNRDIELQNVFNYYKNYIRNIFDILMASLLIYLFNPRYKFDTSLFNYETRFLLFIYGILLFIDFIDNIFVF